MQRIPILMIVLIMSMIGLPDRAQAQYDSSYIESFRGYLFGRFLVNRKYTRMNIANRRQGYQLRYSPNKTFSVGLGVTYKFFTFNFSTGVLEPHPSRGETRDLDLQIHKYGRRFTTDVFLQLYKGFYVPDRKYALNGQDYYVRPDLTVNSFGSAFHYIFNHRKFSYRAAFQQSELQKKSAGSFLVGAEVYLGHVNADSMLLPRALLANLERESEVYRMRFIEIGPNIGYAYTWVYKKIFVSTAASISLNAGINRFFDENGVTTLTGVSPNTMVRISGGYNVKNWGVNLVYISNTLHLPRMENRAIIVNTGNYRMNFVYRFQPNKKVRKMLRVIDRVEERLSR